MSPIESVILGAIEGITEFLPISSTGHLILASSLLGIVQSEFQKSYQIAIQLGAICSVLLLYWRAFLNFETIKKLFVAFLPTAVIGFLFYSFIRSYLLGSEITVVIALFVGGIALIVFELWHREKEDAASGVEQMTYKQSLFVGMAQSIAIIPGVSRSAATIVGGLLLGIKRTTIVEFSFLLAVPTMLAATGYDLLRNASSFSLDQFEILTIGFTTSFIVALFAIKLLLSYVRNHTFIPFGIYRILLALLFFFVIL